MKTVSYLALGASMMLGAMATTSAPTYAGGDAITYGSGLARHQAAVPVPAPAPIPEVSTGYYVRIDAAYSQGDVSKYRSTDTRVDQFRADSYVDNFPRYGFGVGYQYNKWLRGDITIDWRNDVTSRGTGSVNYAIANGAGGTNPTIAMRDTYSDSFVSTNTTGLINVYADMPVHSAFTPYVGAGIGFVRHQLKGRNFSRVTSCIDPLDCDPAAGADSPGFTGLNGTAATTAGGVDYTLAAALMAGFTYKVWDNTKVDLGYRWLHLQGTSFVGRSSATVENLTIPAQNIHELRAGLRFEIN